MVVDKSLLLWYKMKKIKALKISLSIKLCKWIKILKDVTCELMF